MRLRRIQLLIFGLLLLLGALLYHSDSLLFEKPEKELQAAYRRISRQLRREQQLVFLLNFDGRGPREWISSTRPLAPGVEVRTEAGVDRGYFSGTRWSALHTAVPWRHVEPSHTLLLRLKLLPPSDTQDLMFYDGGGRHTGMRLVLGQLQWHVPGTEKSEALSYAFTSWGEEVELVGSYDAVTGTAALYENGIRKAVREVDAGSLPPENINLGSTRWYAMPHPLHAGLREAAIWNRSLSADEIQRLAKRKRPLQQSLAASAYHRLRLARGLERSTKSFARTVNFFNPGLMDLNRQAADLPEVHLDLRKGPLRRQNQAHLQSRQSGRRTADAARFRRVTIRFDGNRVQGSVALDGSDTHYADSPRKAYVVDTNEPLPNGLSSFRLRPPESAGWGEPAVDRALAEALQLPAARAGWCRLYVNGRFEGIYLYEDDRQCGFPPHSSGELLRTPQHPLKWDFLFLRDAAARQLPRGLLREALPLSREEINRIHADADAENLRLLSRDMAAPFSRRELAYRLRLLREDAPGLWIPSTEPDPALRSLEYLQEEMLLGENPSSLYIREDLNLNIALPGSSALEWHSSRPDLLAADGSLLRHPEGGAPVAVVLTAQLQSGGETHRKTFHFRVMPESPRIRALMIHLRDPVQKSRRVDARIEYYGDGLFNPVRFRAFQGARSGIKTRGNTSFWQLTRHGDFDWELRKVPFSIRFEEAHGLLSPTGSRHLYLGTGYSDMTFMRNRLSYDLFRAMGDEDNFRPAPEIEWAEVFVNGNYQGLYEFGSRVDRHMLGWDSARPDSPDHAALYKFSGRGDNFGEPLFRNMGVRQPARFYGLTLDPYLSLIDTLRISDPDVMVQRISEEVDVAGVLDWHLLLNATGNHDGVNVNLYLAREAGPETRFTILPWDYDKTFLDRYPVWLSNTLTDRLHQHHPDYRSGMGVRWRALRQGPWRDEALEELLGQMEAELVGWTEWDEQVWQGRYTRGESFADAVQQLREILSLRLHWLDERFAGAPSSPPAEPLRERSP
ncbi:MAG: CotH kinase family protein [Verrucomicrobia bacterium]|nr:CotH kinase family protein [Verrucomicrobiota bacterium]MCH8525811.1 CotH kinase family protein [Kiritimatiellia bacterium]